MDPLSLAAGIAKSIGGLFQGIMGFNAGNAQAKAMRNAALQAEAEGGQAASQQVEQGNALAATGAVTAAANGGGFVGSSLGVIQHIANRAMFNARAAAYRGRVQAVKDMYDSSVAKADATNSLISGVVSASGSMLGDFARNSAVSRQLQAIQQSRGDYNPAFDASALGE